MKVPQSAWGRTYVLKFSSSDQRHFVRDFLERVVDCCSYYADIVLDAGEYSFLVAALREGFRAVLEVIVHE